MNEKAGKSGAPAKGQDLALTLDSDKIEREVEATLEPVVLAASEDPELEQKAQTYVDHLMGVVADDIHQKERSKQAVELLGRDLQSQSAHRSRMLQQSVALMSNQGADKGPVTNALIDLKLKVEELDPNQIDLEAGWFTRMLGKIPGVGTPLKRYFSRFESAQTTINAIVNSLERGREQLGRDNLTLQDDQRAMQSLVEELERHIRLGQIVDEKLQVAAARLRGKDDARAQFIEEELLFPLRQRIIDLQQQLAVNQQGILASAIVMRNNGELIRGVNRALDVTISALNVAVSTALALANQQIVLDKIQAVNKTTSDMIANTGKRLRGQGAAIQRQSASAMLDMKALQGAFADINAALDEISRFRQTALPQMAKAILELDRMSIEGEKRIKALPEAGAQSPSLTLGS
jgi:uncharacterized protein YaaN involved in tellurite resistance